MYDLVSASHQASATVIGVYEVRILGTPATMLTVGCVRWHNICCLLDHLGRESSCLFFVRYLSTSKIMAARFIAIQITSNQIGFIGNNENDPGRRISSVRLISFPLLMPLSAFGADI